MIRRGALKPAPRSAPLRVAAEAFDVAIVGGGFAGTAVAAGLARIARRPLRVVMFDRAGAFARGAAYSPSSDQCLLNVRAKAMGAFPDAEDDFMRYLRSTGYAADDANLGERFLPRRLYGDYLTSLLEGCGARGVSVERRAAAVSALTPAGDGGFMLETECATRTFAKTVVLAIGNLPPGGFGDPALTAAMAAHAANPWQLLAEGSVDPDAEVLIVGTGLSALDVMLHLTAHGHRGTLTMLSRHGRFPLAHASSAAADSGVAAPLSGTPRDVLRALRGLARDAAHAGRSWHDVIDAVRPQTNRVWQSWTPAEQRQFNRHLAPLWEIHRHRAPASTLGICDELRASGRLRVQRGRLRRLERTRDGLRAIVDAWNGPQCELRADAIVDCTGPRRDIVRSGEPLINALFARGLARPGELGLGFAATPDGRLTGEPGAAPLYALGTPLRGTFAETSAVREIRVQARIIAESIAAAHDARAAGDGIARMAVAD